MTLYLIPFCAFVLLLCKMCKAKHGGRNKLKAGLANSIGLVMDRVVEALEFILVTVCATWRIMYRIDQHEYG